MKIHLRELSKGEQARINGRFDTRELFRGRRDILDSEAAEVDLRASFEDGAAHVEGTMRLRQAYECVRCLSAFCTDWTVPVQEFFSQNKKLAESKEEANYHYVEDERVDLLPYLEENVLLEAPYIPLCDPACKGMNPETGANLNIYPEQKPEKPVDPRLAGLADFFKNSDS